MSDKPTYEELENRINDLESALIKSEERFNHFLKNLPLAYQSLDKDGNFLEVNQFLQDILGYDREELIGRNFRDILHPDWIDHFKENFPRFKQVGEVLGVEFSLVKKDGTTILVSFTGKIQKDDQDHFQQTHCIFLDITEQKRAEEDSLSLKKQLQSLWNVARMTEATHKELCDMVLDEVQKMTGSEFSFFGFLDEEEKEMTLHSWSKEAMATCTVLDKPLHFPIHQAGVWAQAVVDRKSIILNNMKIGHPRMKGLPHGHVPLSNLISVPVLRHGKVVALAAAANKLTGYTAQDVELVHSFTSNVLMLLEKRRTEDSLKQSSKRLLEAQKIGKVGSWEFDVQKGQIWGSDMGFYIYGMVPPPSNLLSINEIEACIPERERVRQALVDLINDGRPYDLEFDILPADNSERKTILSKARLETDSSGNPLRVSGVIVDITDRKKIEEERQHLFQLIDNVDSIAVSKDPELRYLTVNQAYLKLTGHQHLEQIVGKTDEELFHGIATDEQIKEYMDNDRKALLLPEGGCITIEERLAVDDGTERFFLTKKFPIHSKYSGELLGVSTLSTEITERKRSEEALRQNESLFKAMLTAIPDMISIHDTEMNIIYSNWKGLADVPMDRRRIGEKCYRIYREKDKICPDCHMKQVIETRKPYSEELELFDVGWVEMNVIPILDVNGSCEFIIEWMRDINENKKTDAHLRQLTKMEAVGRLAGGVAHDFNNMLAVILGRTDLILEEIEPDHPFYTDIVEIQNAGERSANLTSQLLAFARKQTVKPKVIDLNQTVAGMLKMLRRLIGENIKLAWNPNGNVWPVKIDPGQVDQILANLCVNARDAITDIGKVTIETGNAIFDEDYCRDHTGCVPGEYAMLAVSDNGCGMNIETQAHLFEPFFTTKEQGKGTGLGLATVYGIVKQNKGYINVYSELDLGTTFRIYLQRHKTRETPQSEEKIDSSSGRGHETILLVEDEPAILNMAATMLERQGYIVLQAATPGQALHLATEHVGDVHLLITDVVMPEMNGRDLAKNILSLYPGIKCLFMSGYTANVIAYHGVLDEGVNFIQKPFSKNDLTVKVRKVLEQR